MGFACKFSNPHGVYFVTTAVVQWVDAFTRYQYCYIVVSNANFQFWQQNNHPLVIKDDIMFKECLAYIHNNPVVSGFVKNAEDWLYSSAAGYEKNNGLLKLQY